MILSREHYEHLAKSKYYEVILGLTAFGLMISALVPLEVVLIPSVMAAPKRWRRLWVSGVIGSASGAATLAALFRFVGWPLIDRMVPSLGSSHGWTLAQDWLNRFGGVSLIGVAALPIAQAPILAVCGLLQVPVLEVLAAFSIGKSVKYGLITYGAARGEETIRRRVRTLNGAKEAPNGKSPS